MRILADAAPGKENEMGALGMTPLLVACYHSHVDTVRGLLSAKANLLQRSDGGCTALTIAAEKGCALSVEELLKSERGEAKVAGLLSMTEKHNLTPLMRAAQGGHAGVVQLLLEAMRSNGVDMEEAINATRTDTGRTALNLAARPGHEEVAMILLQVTCPRAYLIAELGPLPRRAHTRLYYRSTAPTGRSPIRTSAGRCTRPPSLATRR